MLDHSAPFSTPIRDLVSQLFPSGFQHVRHDLLQRFGQDVWNRVVEPVLQAPAWALLVAFVCVLCFLAPVGRGRRTAASLPHPETDAAPGPAKDGPESQLKSALAACRGAFLSIGLFSGIINILALTGSMFMLEIYDRVLPSRSVPTLVGLAIITAVLFASQGVLDVIRGRIMVRIGASLDQDLSGQVYSAIVRLPLKVASKNDGLQPLRDLDSVRTFLSSQGPIALFDLPWMPLYLVVIFAFHFYLGVLALAGAVLLVFITLITEVLTRGPIKTATGFGMSRHGLAETSRRNAEVLMAMGMAGHMGARWARANDDYLRSQQRVSDVTSGLGGLSKILRLMLQSGVLAVGAYLVIHQEATAGIIIAGAILTARALAPVDLAIANWRGFGAARQGWQRLSKLLELVSGQHAPLALNPPKSRLSVEGVSAAPPGVPRLVVQDVSFVLKAGQGLGIVGPSASGKSSLTRLLVGVWRPIRGKVRLDGADLDQWSAEALGCHIGYLPQDVELFPGTVAQNIARFQPDPVPGAIIAAAEAAGVHDLIVGLAGGYDTTLGEQGAGLSAGQQQRIALARALYGDPFLVVLDEPNSNLDFDGERALTQAILGIRARGGIVIVVAHREAALAGVDVLLALVDGRAQLLGPKDEVLAKLRKPTVPAPVLTLAEAGGPKR